MDNGQARHVRIRDRALEVSWNGGEDIVNPTQWAAGLTTDELDEFRRVEHAYAVEYGDAVRVERSRR